MPLCPGGIMASGIINETSATNLEQGVATRPARSECPRWSRGVVYDVYECVFASSLADISTDTRLR